MIARLVRTSGAVFVRLPTEAINKLKWKDGDAIEVQMEKVPGVGPVIVLTKKQRKNDKRKTG